MTFWDRIKLAGEVLRMLPSLIGMFTPSPEAKRAAKAERERRARQRQSQAAGAAAHRASRTAGQERTE